MKRTLTTEDITIKGLEEFCTEARDNGAVDEDSVRLFPEYRGNELGRTRRARIEIELPTPLRRVLNKVGISSS